MNILNLTMHDTSKDQKAAGVEDLDDQTLDTVKELLLFNTIPTKDEIQVRAEELATIAYESGYFDIMIGGAPYLMGPLEYELSRFDLKAVYAFSARVSEESTDSDGKVTKVNVFKHLGFVEA